MTFIIMILNYIALQPLYHEIKQHIMHITSGIHPEYLLSKITY